MAQKYRIEADSLGQLKIPVKALYGAQTQRAIENFPVSQLPMPIAFISVLGLIKKIAATVNQQLGLLDSPRATAIIKASAEVQASLHDMQFPVDVFQTGSGTSSNMNANEVIATLAAKSSGLDIHPNDHVNLGQSSNDVIPTAIHISATLQLTSQLLPALTHLQQAIEKRALELKIHVTTGRTHLMDAMPVSLSQELDGWAAQTSMGIQRLQSTLPRLCQLAQGGTAVGTGINAHAQFAQHFAGVLSKETGLPFVPSACFFESLSCQDSAVELSGQLRVVAVSIMKIANDLRWMNSGPLAGLGEIELQGLQPGSSIMPGKVNPVIPESAAMVAAQVMGNDATIAIAGQSGNFQLNVMLPVIAYNLLQSIELLTSTCNLLADKAIATFTVNADTLQQNLARNPMLVTALTPVIGYDKAAEIAKQAYREKRSILDVAAEVTNIPREQLTDLLAPDSLLNQPSDRKRTPDHN
ncbi:MAG: class II fumarate hydratase [Pseudomonadales bacterium]